MDMEKKYHIHYNHYYNKKNPELFYHETEEMTTYEDAGNQGKWKIVKKSNRRILQKNYHPLILQHQRTPNFTAIPVRILTIALILPLCLPLLLSGCTKTQTPISRTGFYFDTMIQITVYEKKEEPLLEDCLELAGYYEGLLSPTVEGSDIWNINHNNGQPVVVSDETLLLLQTALSYSEITSGRIDPTMETVSQLWDFHTQDTSATQESSALSEDSPSTNQIPAVSEDSLSTNRIPSEKDLAEAIRHVDYHNLSIKGNTVTLLDPEAAISLGFIAKGFIADKIKEYLLSQQVKSAIINLGGNLLAVGSKPDGTPFQFGIQKPFDSQGTPIDVLSVSDKSLVSSGIYERYFYQDNTLYHHILNSDTGYPIQNHLLSVTILSDSSMIGDALSTSCFVLGLEEGMALIESLEEVEAVFITEDFVLHYSSGIENR
ncbi:MAG: FAD:protein FMN transferase [Muribaculaceae bacterium]|nr:FAD:protein FMN transferase [Muribaculaceae bacterium]